jgi:flagellar M-ring protein FliF
MLAFMFHTSEIPYTVLYAGLSPEDAGAVTAELKTQKIPYRLAAEGTAIEVETSRASAVRLDLAVKGLPAKSNVGFEIFDEQKLGVTDLVQKTNLMRAVTGELERSIMSLPEVEMARVHVAVPSETLFIEDQKDPTASVVIKVRRGSELSKPQLQGIVNLVVSAVSGLSPDNVSVIDADGGLIWSKETNKPGLLNDDQMRQKALYEDAIKRRIQAMMERVVGFDRAITSVHADLDLKEVVTNEDIYDPERSAVRSEQKIQERSLGPARAMAGIPNATYELGTANRQNSGANGQQEQYSRSEETNNYEVTNIKRQTVSKAGDLKKISVSVLLDGVYAKNEAGEKVFSPLPQELIASLEEAVKGVVGFDAKRGDLVSVTSVQFARTEEVSAWALFALELVREFYRPFLNLILIILFFFLVVRPIMNWLKKEVEPAGAGAEAPVLPEYPGGASGFSEGLPLPLPPQAAVAGDLAASAPTALEVAAGGEMAETNYSGEEDTPQYDEEIEDEAEEEEDDTPPALAYGTLSRDNILPLARENMDRTVGLVRGWIDQKAPQPDESKS